MTTDEMVAEIQQLSTAVDYEGRIGRPVGSRAYDELLDATATLRAVMGGAL